MTSPPLITREYAYFCITGSGLHEYVTEELKIKPSEAWKVGDLNPKNGKPRKFMQWCLNSGLEDKVPLEQHIQSLYLFLIPKADELRLLWEEYDLILPCVGYFPTSGHGMHFNREHIRQAARLGLVWSLILIFILWMFTGTQFNSALN